MGMDFVAMPIHDAFINSRGKDTCASFTSHLYASLQNAAINVFRVNDSLQRGDHISTSLIRAIEQSQMYIIVFSTNYAQSRWCLDELEKIMGYHRAIRQIVLSVFYHVDPSEVRHQTGEFVKAFQNLLNWIENKENEYLQLNLRIALDWFVSNLSRVSS
jgi:hypothetical protein